MVKKSVVVSEISRTVIFDTALDGCGCLESLTSNPIMGPVHNP